MVAVAASAEVASLARDLALASGDSIEKSAASILQTSAQRIVHEAQVRAPIDTGKLQSSIHAKWNSPLSVEIGPGVDYGVFQEFGTGTRGEFPGSMYEIRPKKKDGRLVFKIGGKTIVTKLVKHPGVKAQPYMRPAFEHVMADFLQKLLDEGTTAITRGPNA
jgi:HK97 gp10 family phage protein